MIAVIEKEPGVFEPVSGDVLTSLDGEVRAPLATIMAPSWTAEDRAKFGVYVAEPVEVPAGKVASGAPRYERKGSSVVEVRDLQDEAKPVVLTPTQKVEQLAARFGLTLDELRNVLTGRV